MKMKHNWPLVVVILFMLSAGAAERFSSSYVQRLRADDKALAQRAEEMKSRMDGAPVETKKYQEIERLAALVQDQIRWEPDSTRVMRSLGDIATRLGVRLVETRTVSASADTALTPGGAYQRMHIEARLMGSFWGLVQYIDSVERSTRPMVIESISMTADRDKSGTGELHMTVSALYPAPSATGSGATTGGAK
jgi:hypothetical protein